MLDNWSSAQAPVETHAFSPSTDFIPISKQSLNQQHKGFPGCTTKEKLWTLSGKLNFQGAKPYNMMEDL